MVLRLVQSFEISLHLDAANFHGYQPVELLLVAAAIMG